MSSPADLDGLWKIVPARAIDPMGRTTFFPLLAAWLLFPLHAPITLLLLDAPFGRFAWKSAANVGARLGWVVMEIVAVSVHQGGADGSP